MSCTICTDSAYYPHVDCEAGPAAHPANGEAVSGRTPHRCEADRQDVAAAAALSGRLLSDPRSPANAEAARTAPDELLKAYPPPIIIDEIQYAPSLLRHLKVRIDQDRSPGRFLLTGSQVFPLMQGVSESLAGRCAVLNLHTLARAEVLAAGRAIEESRYLFLGGYPELHLGVDPDLWFPAYVATYLERDVRNVLRVADLPEFNRFLRAADVADGQLLGSRAGYWYCPQHRAQMGGAAPDVGGRGHDRTVFRQSYQAAYQGA